MHQRGIIYVNIDTRIDIRRSRRELINVTWSDYAKSWYFPNRFLICGPDTQQMRLSFVVTCDMKFYDLHLWRYSLTWCRSSCGDVPQITAVKISSLWSEVSVWQIRLTHNICLVVQPVPQFVYQLARMLSEWCYRSICVYFQWSGFITYRPCSAFAPFVSNINHLNFRQGL